MPTEKTYSAMAKVYARLVKAGTWQINDVPTKWREEVKEILGQ